MRVRGIIEVVCSHKHFVVARSVIIPLLPQTVPNLSRLGFTDLVPSDIHVVAFSFLTTNLVWVWPRTPRVKCTVIIPMQRHIQYSETAICQEKLSRPTLITR